MRDCKVDRFSPKRAAEPSFPETIQLLSSSAVRTSAYLTVLERETMPGMLHSLKQMGCLGRPHNRIVPANAALLVDAEWNCGCVRSPVASVAAKTNANAPVTWMAAAPNSVSVDLKILDAISNELQKRLA
jgi:hypothetical protein